MSQGKAECTTSSKDRGAHRVTHMRHADRHTRGFPEGEQRQEGVDVWVDGSIGATTQSIHGLTASEQNKKPEADSSGRASKQARTARNQTSYISVGKDYSCKPA